MRVLGQEARHTPWLKHALGLASSRLDLSMTPPAFGSQLMHTVMLIDEEARARGDLVSSLTFQCDNRYVRV